MTCLAFCPKSPLSEHESLPDVPARRRVKSTLPWERHGVTPRSVARLGRAQGGQDSEDVVLHQLLPGQHHRGGSPHRPAVGSSLVAQSDAATLVFIFFGVGIARAWELLGLGGGGLLDLLSTRGNEVRSEVREGVRRAGNSGLLSQNRSSSR